MKSIVALGTLLTSAILASAESPQIDSDLSAFSNYVSDVSRLDGMYRGVADYCRQFVPDLILNQSDAAWQEHNGPYVDSLNLAITKFISARVEKERIAAAIAQMQANAQSWFQNARDNSKVLDRVQRADNKSIACSNMLGTMTSESFYLKKLFPADDEYWSRNLRP